MKSELAVLLRSRIRHLRESQGMTQDTAAERCQITYKYYQSFESGRRCNPTLRTLEKMANGLGVKVHDLLNPHAKF